MCLGPVPQVPRHGTHDNERVQELLYTPVDDKRETPLASSLSSFGLLLYINYKPKVKECLKREFISGCE